ncbi:hypothetical protein ES703_14483 [subsurface metagenome]
MKGVLCFLFFLSTAALAVYTETDQLSLAKRLDWQDGALSLDIRLDIPPEERILPKTRYLAESSVQQRLPALFIESVLDILVDSLSTVGERIRGDEALLQELIDLALGGSKKHFAYFSRDFRQIHIRYEFPFFGDQGLITPFIEHTRPFPMRRFLGFEPSRAYTGLVIFAKGLFPAHGKRGTERINAAFFPRLYDEEMNLILSAEMCEPESLKKWGLAGYTDSVDVDRFEERVGLFPLKTMARGVFGKNSTDILIPNDVARKLLSREANHNLLSQGRILIILD